MRQQSLALVISHYLSSTNPPQLESIKSMFRPQLTILYEHENTFCVSIMLCFRMQQQSGTGNGSTRRALSPGPGASDSEDSDISLGGTSPASPSSSPPPTHQPSPVPLGPLGPLPPPSLNFRFDPSQSQFRFNHATAFKFPPAGFRFGPHSPQHNHPNISGGGIFRLTETSPFQAVGPRGDLGSRRVAFKNLSLIAHSLINPRSMNLESSKLNVSKSSRVLSNGSIGRIFCKKVFALMTVIYHIKFVFRDCRTCYIFKERSC